MVMPCIVSCIAPSTWLLISTDSRVALPQPPARCSDGADQQRRRDHEDDQATAASPCMIITPISATSVSSVARDRGDRQVQQVADAADVLVDLGGELGRARIAEEADAERHQMGIEPALVARDDIVADLGQHHGLAIGGKAAHHEGDEDRAADDQTTGRRAGWRRSR